MKRTYYISMPKLYYNSLYLTKDYLNSVENR